ncbi:MAG: LAGLIDADG family homing endonuclease [bacterium]|nr:LAGLIDADG family homing endonuclease [bacterium]
MHRSWSKGFTKETHPSLRKTSETMKARKVNNFALWMGQMKKEGKIKSKYPKLRKSGDLAEFIGVVLGDGHLQKFPRTERLLIFSNSNNPGFVKRYQKITKELFRKEPYVYKEKAKNCIRISLYEKKISERLRIPLGSRKNTKVRVPRWILAKDEYVVRYLRGLYEAEGSAMFHKGTSTHKFSFSNFNKSMLDNVFRLMRRLGFHPHRDHKRVQISRKEEVARAAELLQFRRY